MTRGDVLRVAAEAYCTADTVRRYCQGRSQHALTVERVENALRELGFEPSEVRGSEQLPKAV